MFLKAVMTAAEDKFVTLLFSHKSHALLSEKLECFHHSYNSKKIKSAYKSAEISHKN